MKTFLFAIPICAKFADLDYSKRPVIGILSEPLRDESQQSYLPKTHVQFLEQTGMRVVAVDYRLPTAERHALYE
jgi:hypothetical protein